MGAGRWNPQCIPITGCVLLQRNSVRRKYGFDIAKPLHYNPRRDDSRCAGRNKIQVSFWKWGTNSTRDAALARVAIRVLSDPDLEARLIAEAHEHVRRFDWSDIAAETATVYADLIATKTGPA